MSLKSLLEYMGIDTDLIEVVEKEDEVVIFPFTQFIHITINEPDEGTENDCS